MEFDTLAFIMGKSFVMSCAFGMIALFIFNAFSVSIRVKEIKTQLEAFSNFLLQQLASPNMSILLNNMRHGVKQLPDIESLWLRLEKRVYAAPSALNKTNHSRSILVEDPRQLFSPTNFLQANTPKNFWENKLFLISVFVGLFFVSVGVLTSEGLDAVKSVKVSAVSFSIIMTALINGGVIILLGTFLTAAYNMFTSEMFSTLNSDCDTTLDSLNRLFPYTPEATLILANYETAYRQSTISQSMNESVERLKKQSEFQSEKLNEQTTNLNSLKSYKSTFGSKDIIKDIKGEFKKAVNNLSQNLNKDLQNVESRVSEFQQLLTKYSTPPGSQTLRKTPIEGSRTLAAQKPVQKPVNKLGIEEFDLFPDSK